MNTAVATKMPTRSPDAISAGRIGATSGRNSAGREFARKNSTNGPRSSTSLRSGLSCGLSWVAMVPADWSLDPSDRPREVLRLERREVVDALAHADEMHGQAKLRCDGDQDAATRGAVEL